MVIPAAPDSSIDLSAVTVGPARGGRERWIGRSQERRFRRLRLIRSNSRFVNLTPERVPNLASRASPEPAAPPGRGKRLDFALRSGSGASIEPNPLPVHGRKPCLQCVQHDLNILFCQHQRWRYQQVVARCPDHRSGLVCLGLNRFGHLFACRGF